MCTRAVIKRRSAIGVVILGLWNSDFFDGNSFSGLFSRVWIFHLFISLFIIRELFVVTNCFVFNVSNYITIIIEQFCEIFLYSCTKFIIIARRAFDNTDNYG